MDVLPDTRFHPPPKDCRQCQICLHLSSCQASSTGRWHTLASSFFTWEKTRKNNSIIQGLFCVWFFSYMSHLLRQGTVVFFVLFLFYLGFTAHQNYFTHFESIAMWGEKGDPQAKTPDHTQAELGLSHMWPAWGSNPQRWDDERFRALKISSLNHSATGATILTVVR